MIDRWAEGKLPVIIECKTPHLEYISTISGVRAAVLEGISSTDGPCQVRHCCVEVISCGVMPPGWRRTRSFSAVLDPERTPKCLEDLCGSR